MPRSVNAVASRHTEIEETRREHSEDYGSLELTLGPEWKESLILN